MGLEDVKSKGGKSNKNEIRNKRNKKKLKMTKFFSAEDKMSFFEENYYDKADYMGLEDVKSKGGKSNKNEIRNKRNKKKLKMTKFFSDEDKMSFFEENYYDKADYM